MLVDLFSLLGGTAQPLQDSPFRHAQREAEGRQLHFAQQQFEHEEDGLLHRAQIKEDRPAGLSELLTPPLALKDTTPTALGRVGRNRSYIATVHLVSMGLGWEIGRSPPEPVTSLCAWMDAETGSSRAVPA